MKKMVLALFILLAGCAQLAPNRTVEDPATVQRGKEENELVAAEKMLAAGKFEKSLEMLKAFQQSYPQSVFFQASRLKESEALQGQGNYEESAALNREIYLKTSRYQPDIAARALYSSSFAYEAMGDDLKTVAALLDAQKLRQHLPAEVALAEIPARLAAVYARQGRQTEAVSYLNDAEKGMTKVMNEKGPTVGKDWLGKTYFQMGNVSTNQLSKETFSQFVQGQMWVQAYLIKAMKLDDPVWSLKAQNRLQETYRDLYTVFESTSSNRTLQTQLGGDFFDLMDQAELFRPILGQPSNGNETNFFSYLTDIRTKTEKILYGNKENMTLTEESQRLNGLRRSGRIKADSYLPEEKKSLISLPPKVVPSEDPNL